MTDPEVSHTPIQQPSVSLRVLVIFLRLAAGGTALDAAVKIVLAKQTYYYYSIKATDFSAHMYFIVANLIVFAYSLLSLPISFAISPLLLVSDVMMIVILFSCNGVTYALLTDQVDNGNIYDPYCKEVRFAILLSLIAAVTYIKVFIISAVNLHRGPY